MNKDELLGSKNFCMMPWVHLHLWPNGSAFPCCIWDSNQSLGQYDSKTSLIDLWNSPVMKSLRKNMLNDRPSPGCGRCYLLEEGGQNWTLRKTSLKDFGHHFDLVDKTGPDGELSEMNINYLDIRFSNLCNLKCQTCGPELSSAWYDDQLLLDSKHSSPKHIQIDPKNKFWSELEPQLLNVEKAYFAGGEPLVSDEMYRIMDFWTKHERFDIDINYTTNFTLLNHKNSRILDYWKKFPKVSVSASLDDSGARAEYLRKGTIWDTIVRNRELMMEECPHVEFNITPTISAYNVFHFPEFHWEWIEKGLLTPDNIRLNILTHQEFMSVRILPLEVKKLVKQKWELYLNKIQHHCWSRKLPVWQTEFGYTSLINFMMAEDHEHLLKDFFKRVNQVDSIRKEKVFDVYPELGMLWIGVKK